VLLAGADRAAWLHGTCHVGPLVRRPGGPSRQVGQTNYPVNWWKVGGQGAAGARNKVIIRTAKEGAELGGGRGSYS